MLMLVRTFFVYLPMLFSWAVCTHYISGWSHWLYISTFIALSIIAYIALPEDGHEKFKKIFVILTAINAVVYIFLRYSGLIGPDVIWASILLGLFFILLSVAAIFNCIIIDDNNIPD